MGSELLLKPSAGGATSSTAQAVGNIIVSVVGTGVLGLPYAFRVAGWFVGSISVTIVGLATYCCMLKLVECRNKLSSSLSLSSEDESIEITYGDLGHKCLGWSGRFLTESLIVIAQCAGCMAYLVFIGQNLSSIFINHGLTFSSFMLVLVPLEILLSLIRSLSSLAPFSIFADICNGIAMTFVLKGDVEQMVRGGFAALGQRKAVTSSIRKVPFAAGVAVFCYEGFGMTLALEASMRERTKFSLTMALSFLGITVAYVCFGMLGYLAYGDDTKDIITLNLPDDWSAIAVQIGLCLGLAFTLPIMMHPIHEIVEGKLWGSSLGLLQQFHDDNGGSQKLRVLGTYIGRAALVVGLAVVAACVPGFGVFVSFVGSSMCGLISFVLPAYFHLRLLGSSLSLRQRASDYLFLLSGVLFAFYGTCDVIVGISKTGL